MPQGDYIDLHRKRNGLRFDHYDRLRKKEARSGVKRAQFAKKVFGLRAKLYHAKRYKEKAEMKKLIRLHEEKSQKQDVEPTVEAGAKPVYLLDRNEVTRAKTLSNMLKQKKKARAGKWDVPLPKVRPMPEIEMMSVVKSGKRRKKSWKRVINKMTFVGDGFTRKPPKYERFIRPMGLRIKKAHVTHPELKSTFYLDILGVKKNPQGQMFSSLGVLTKGTVIEVNTANLGLVTQAGRIVWGKYAQVTNNPENDGCVNAVLLV